MAHARKEQGGSGKGHHVGPRTQVGTGSTYASIVNSSTDNRVRCQRCNGTFFEVKGTHYVDRDETHPAVLHSGNESAGTADCVILRCIGCGQEHTFDVDTGTDWTDQAG